MEPFLLGLLSFAGVVVGVGGLVVFVLWLRRGHRYADAVSEWFVLLLLVGVAAGFVVMGVALDSSLLPSALVQVGAGMVAGVFVGVVILLERDRGDGGGGNL